MKWKLTYYEWYLRESATIYLSSKGGVLKFIEEKGEGQIMSYTEVDGDIEPYEFQKEEI